MADVSIRFTVAGDAEIVLNLEVPQALRLAEALTRKIAEVVSAGGANREPPAGTTGAWSVPRSS